MNREELYTLTVPQHDEDPYYHTFSNVLTFNKPLKIDSITVLRIEIEFFIDKEEGVRFTQYHVIMKQEETSNELKELTAFINEIFQKTNIYRLDDEDDEYRIVYEEYDYSGY